MTSLLHNPYKYLSHHLIIPHQSLHPVVAAHCGLSLSGCPVALQGCQFSCPIDSTEVLTAALLEWNFLRSNAIRLSSSSFSSFSLFVHPDWFEQCSFGPRGKRLFLFVAFKKFPCPRENAKTQLVAIAIVPVAVSSHQRVEQPHQIKENTTRLLNDAQGSDKGLSSTSEKQASSSERTEMQQPIIHNCGLDGNIEGSGKTADQIDDQNAPGAFLFAFMLCGKRLGQISVMPAAATTINGSSEVLPAAAPVSSPHFGKYCFRAQCL